MCDVIMGVVWVFDVLGMFCGWGEWGRLCGCCGLVFRGQMGGVEGLFQKRG